jgi:hypothetical protein
MNSPPVIENSGLDCMEFHDHMPIRGELFGAEKRPTQ